MIRSKPQTIHIDGSALLRLKTWSDPSASGDPTERMRKIWPSPMHLQRDIASIVQTIETIAGSGTKVPAR